MSFRRKKSSFRLRRTGSSAEMLNVSEDPYVDDVDELVSKVQSVFGGQKNTQRRIDALTDLYFLSWNGGDTVQTYIGKKGLLETLTDVLEAGDNPDLTLPCIKSLSVLCRDHKGNQDILRRLGGVSLLIDYLDAKVDVELRKWAAHCLFFVVFNNPTNQEVARKTPNISSRLAKVSQLNWDGWTYNDADEIMKCIGLEMERWQQELEMVEQIQGRSGKHASPKRANSGSSAGSGKQLVESPVIQTQTTSTSTRLSGSGEMEADNGEDEEGAEAGAVEEPT